MDWGLYNRSLTVQGDTRRDRVIAQTQRIIDRKANNSPAHKRVLIDGKPQNVVITSSTEKYHKKINALPGEHIYAGSTVFWNNRYFLITDTDVEDEIYQSGNMYQCTVYIKWQNEKGEIIGRYGYSEDLSQFKSGVVDSKVMMSLEQIFKVQLPMDSETVKLRRDKRFLIDVINDEPNAYILTNRNVLTNNFSPKDIEGDPNSGPNNFDGRDKVLLLTFTQTQLSEKDNCELMIADYFDPASIGDQNITNGSCSIVYSGQPIVKVGGSYKKFTAEFISSGKIMNFTPVWDVTIMPEFEDKFTIIKSDNWIKIKAANDTKLIGTQILLRVTDPANLYNAELYVKVVSLYG